MNFNNTIFYRNTSINNSPTGVITSALDVTNEATVKGFNIINSNNYSVYLKFYDTTTVNTTVGTTTPIGILQIPANSCINEIPNSENYYLKFSTAITIAVTKLLIDSDNTSLTTGLYIELTIEIGNLE